ncbi:hypothetical protein BU25DRAFT_218874 [Macroventuria anomochaeta]|uniref:Uncharacterized protein n=1 Tax=Macroventuria anomochaeta TaxID=301207 RepID=A0ACB6RL17_9PLEO|nr:uncharacterized protein BU25DRAFT_218874 [Macroventuria anomochaeta]KAF2622090.1 hypothetical protein BU25DRAFT_218874 [Macroventuria anomochaeta]
MSFQKLTVAKLINYTVGFSSEDARKPRLILSLDPTQLFTMIFLQLFLLWFLVGSIDEGIPLRRDEVANRKPCYSRQQSCTTGHFSQVLVAFARSNVQKGCDHNVSERSPGQVTKVAAHQP